jgi:hypothetical protein
MIWLALACTEPELPQEEPVTETPDAFSLGPVRACEQPIPLSYSQVGEDLGLLGPEQEPELHGEGGGTLLADLNGDGHLELLYGLERESWIHWGTGPGRFVAGIGVPFAGGVGLSPLGVGRVLLGSVRLAVVDFGAGEELGYSELVAPSESVVRAPSVADFDGDGWQDLYVGRGHPNLASEREDLVFWGGTEGLIQEAAELVSPELSGEAFDSVVLDFDQDGWTDLYVVNDRGPERGANRLYRGSSQGLSLVQDCGACAFAHSPMGVDAADVNGDGWVDLLIAATIENQLLFGGADGRFVQAPPIGQTAFSGESMGWGGVIADVDNDGLPDLWIAAGDQSYEGGGSFGVPETPYLQLQQADGSFVDVAPDLGMDLVGSWRTTLAHDQNQDGVLDLLLSSAFQAPALWLSDGCTAQTWLEVEAPVMSRVEVHAGGRVQVAWVSNESSFQSVKPAVAHFGLGEAEQVERVIVELPLGGGRFEIAELSARRRITLVPESD